MNAEWGAVGNLSRGGIEVALLIFLCKAHVERQEAGHRGLQG